jgi:glucodextranase-like protein
MARNRRSRLQRIEDKKNRHQAVMFFLLTIGFILLLIFVGFPMFVKGAIWFGDRKSAQVDNSSIGDKIPPLTPKIVLSYEATNTAEIDIRGYTEASASVKLSINLEDTEVKAKEDGSFVFEKIGLMEGENFFSIVAIDKAGNESIATNQMAITYDYEAPSLDVSQPSDGDKYYDDEREILVAGTTDADAKVRINGNVVVVGPEGNFVKRMKLSNGDNEIVTVATDKAGNVSEKKVVVKLIN